jgi:hypothetical protein
MSVPPVVIMSSAIIAIFPLMSPTIALTSDTSGSGRRLITIASVLFNRFANHSARDAACIRGYDDDSIAVEATVPQIRAGGRGSKLSTGISKKPWT